MNAPHDYIPAMRSADLGPVAIGHLHELQPKWQRALIYRDGLPPVGIEHAARGHAFALVYFGQSSRWRLLAGGKTIGELLPRAEQLDAKQKRWRIVEVASALVREES